ncbi:MAG: hypothetical protein GOV00_02025 [Candidatus Altiarchaeota archaeon]|nr:hypothetical protein [Candidatus Altiarchaeota archaeon]
MRPRMNLELRGLAPKLKGYLGDRLEKEGPVSERELWGWALEFFAPQLKVSSANLTKSYKMMYGRKIGAKTAEINILNSLRLLLSTVKRELSHTEKKIILGKERLGRIFYAGGQENQIRRKIRQLLGGTGSRAEEVLKAVGKGPFAITASHKKAVEMLEYYGLVETKKIGGKFYAVPEGHVGVVELEKGETVENRKFPSHFRIWEPFSAGIWILKDGPVKKTLRFDIAAWDPKNRIFYVGLNKTYVSQKDIMMLRERVGLLHLPTKTLIFCETHSKAAGKYAESWGIELRLGVF